MTIVPADAPRSAPGDPPSKIWRAGTLTYTTGGLVVLFCWLLWGDFAWSMKERAVGPIFQLLLKSFGASDLVTGFLSGSLPPAVGMIVVPIIAYKSDRHRGRWGRRIPFLLFPSPVIALAVAGLACSPSFGGYLDLALGSHSFGRNTCVLIFLGAFWTLFDFAAGVTNSIYGAFLNDVVPHEVIGRFFGLFRAMSLVAGIVFNRWLFGKAETLYLWIFLGIAGLYGIGFTLMCLKVKEGAYPPQPAMDAGRVSRGFVQGARTYLRECFGHSYYRWFFGAMTLSAVCTGPVNLFSVFFAKSLGMSLDSYGKCLALTYLISLAIAYPLGWLADRFHPLRLNVVLLVLYAGVALWGGLFVRDTWTFGVALVAHGVVAGTWNTCTASIGQRLLPKQEFAQFDSARGIVLSLGWMLLSPAVGFFLDRVHHHYRYTFLVGFGLTLAALLSSLVLQSKFMALGGPDHYVAPE